MAFELGRCFSLVLGVDSRQELLETARVRNQALFRLPTRARTAHKLYAKMQLPVSQARLSCDAPAQRKYELMNLLSSSACHAQESRRTKLNRCAGVQEMKDVGQAAYQLPGGHDSGGQAATAILDPETDTDHVRFAQVSTPHVSRCESPRHDERRHVPHSAAEV